MTDDEARTAVGNLSAAQRRVIKKLHKGVVRLVDRDASCARWMAKRKLADGEDRLVTLDGSDSGCGHAYAKLTLIGLSVATFIDDLSVKKAPANAKRDNASCAEAWKNGRRKALDSMKTDGDRIWSYGMVIGYTKPDGSKIALGRTGDVSMTTAAHYRLVHAVADKIELPAETT